MKTSKTITKIMPALLKAQIEIGSAKKGSVNPFFSSNYADLGEVMEVCKEPLNKNGIIVLQPCGITKNGGEYIETILIHESGEFLSSRIKLIYSKQRVKPEEGEIYFQENPQAQGSAISYAKRYALQAMLFIPSEDDDGEKAMARKPVETKQVKTKQTETKQKTTDKPETKVCPIHKKTMYLYTKDGKYWYSHKLDNGKWCSGK
jgi:hypothetical protein